MVSAAADVLRSSDKTVREVYQMPGVGDSVNMRHIKAHYYTSHPTLNPYAVVPAGPNVIEDLKLPHDRESVQSA